MAETINFKRFAILQAVIGTRVSHTVTLVLTFTLQYGSNDSHIQNIYPLKDVFRAQGLHWQVFVFTDGAAKNVQEHY